MGISSTKGPKITYLEIVSKIKQQHLATPGIIWENYADKCDRMDDRTLGIEVTLGIKVTKRISSD